MEVRDDSDGTGGILKREQPKTRCRAFTRLWLSPRVYSKHSLFLSNVLKSALTGQYTLSKATPDVR